MVLVLVPFLLWSGLTSTRGAIAAEAPNSKRLLAKRDELLRSSLHLSGLQKAALENSLQPSATGTRLTEAEMLVADQLMNIANDSAEYLNFASDLFAIHGAMSNVQDRAVVRAMLTSRLPYYSMQIKALMDGASPGLVDSKPPIGQASGELRIRLRETWKLLQETMMLLDSLQPR
jgi:hypothetical protein